LDSLHVLAEGAEFESWIFHVATKAMAEWSCNIARSVALNLMDNFKIMDNFKAAGVAPLYDDRELFLHKFF